MKKLYFLLSIGFLLFLSGHASANEVIVKGYLKLANGTPVINQQLKISIDSTTSTCRQTKVVATDQNGFYTTTLSCSINFARVIIATSNCNGTYLVETPQVPPSAIVEKNFTICQNPPTNCVAEFKFEKSTANQFLYQFNSSTSHGTTSADNIVKRKWRFGDGTVLEGNEISPKHTYSAKGTYEVCLTIVTAAGCEKTICQKIIIEGAPVNCEAAFKFEKSISSHFLYHFNSTYSKGSTSTDNIVKRKWRFGDGTVLEGNEISPKHTYAAKGTYEVCLTIVTAAGCEKTTCQKIIIEGAPVNCEAAFKFEKSISNHFLYQFNSTYSKGSTATDNIVKRKWRFGDGTILEGNEISPKHTYAAKGTYEVCLTIVTAAGCEKTTCQKIIIEENTACKAEFTFIHATGNFKEIKFNSAASTTSPGDNIISRQWNFGDGKTATTVDPVHMYDKEGTYRVCLTIKTASGCVKEVCKTIEIVGTKCEASFDYEYLPYTASIAGMQVRFINKSHSNDSEVTMLWTFGDGTTDNTKNPLHKFAQPGLYNVCLTIKTRNGCESKTCKQVLVGPNAITCLPKISLDRISPKKIKFNSSASMVAAGDQITSRSWFFGDGTSVTTGNQVSVEKEYNRPGNYSVCLYIKTAKGCENKICIPVKIEESTPAISDERIKIITLYPAPVHTRMTTEVWSFGNNVNATLAIYDIYGVKKWEEKKVLVQGTNVNVVATGFLFPGPYLFKVTTMYGVKSKQFYKM